MPPRQGRHRAGALKQSNKTHKTGKHRSKGALDAIQKGKVTKQFVVNYHRTLTRKERKNRAVQIRKNVKEKLTVRKNKLGGQDGAPFLVAVIPLNLGTRSSVAVEALEVCAEGNIVTKSSRGVVHITSQRYKQRYSFICPEVGHGLEFAVLDALKVADTVMFVVSAHDEVVIDDWGHLILTAVKAQGLPTSIVTCLGIKSLKDKQRSKVRQSVSQCVQKYLPDEKVIDLDNTGDAMNVLRTIGSQKQRDIIHRDNRPHLYSEQAEFIPTDTTSGLLKLTGFLRGANLDVNRLIHIPGVGDFQMQKLESLSDPHRFDKYQADNVTLPAVHVIAVADPAKQESLASENIPDPMDAEQTWPTAEELQEADAISNGNEQKLVKRVPKGMSDYQAAWIPDVGVVSDSEDEEVDLDVSMEEDAISENGDCEEDSESEVEVGVEKYDEEINLQSERKDLEMLRAAQSDKQFPDELDTPLDVPARERFLKYRGLESFRTSPWDPKENLPIDYAKIFQFQNYERTCRKMWKQANSEVQEHHAKVGQYITVYVSGVPYHLGKNIVSQSNSIVIIGLLPHEHKMSVMNVKLKQVAEHNEPIKSKERLVIQCGYRRFIVNPVFSEHSNGSRHKFERFFQPENTVVATFYAPIQFSPATVLCYRLLTNLSLKLVATGSLISCNPDRVVLKRIVLSGHLFKINKRSAVVRFMFFNRDDILYFKPCKLRTRFGKVGHIKEPLGTHGHMKCIFDGQIRSQDIIFLNLYKRVFPKWTFENYTFINDTVEEMPVD